MKWQVLKLYFAGNGCVREQVTAEEPVANGTICPWRQNPYYSAAKRHSLAITGMFLFVNFIHFCHFYSAIFLPSHFRPLGPKRFHLTRNDFCLDYFYPFSMQYHFLILNCFMYCHLEFDELMRSEGLHYCATCILKFDNRIRSDWWGPRGQW